MLIRILDQAAPSVDSPLVVVAAASGDAPLGPAAQQLDQALNGVLSRARRAGDFRGTDDASLLVYGGGEPDGETGTGEASVSRRYLMLGVGDAEKVDASTARALAARAVRKAEELGVTTLHLVVPLGQGAASREAADAMQAAAEGAELAAWDFRELRGGAEGFRRIGTPDRPRVTELSLSLDLAADEAVADVETQAEAVRVGQAFAQGENLARTLQQRPGNVATPEHLAATALQLGEEYGFRVTVLGPREMAEENMGALLAVAAGSDQEPRLMVLEHRGGEEGAPPLVLVGKGLTFDSGGISLKPPAGMEDMKFDMSGGAAVLGAMKAIGILGLPVNVVGVVPSSENMVNGRATKPGDVVRTRAGITVEVINTDAEGRLILADALHYAAERFGPRAMVDCATLTGACVIALGHHASAVMGTDDDLVAALREAGDRSGERCWPLPLWEVYRKQLESPVADLKNVGGRPAGSITAGMFLRQFVGDTPWAHLDIAGSAYGDPLAPWQRKGGFGIPTRLLLEWVRRAAQ